MQCKTLFIGLLSAAELLSSAAVADEAKDQAAVTTD